MNRRTSARVLASVSAGVLVLVASPPSSVAATLWSVGLTASGTAMARSVPIPAAPGKPTAVCDGVVSSAIDVSWAAVSGARAYTVYRNTSFLKSVPASTLNIQDSLLSLAGSYYYTVTADIVSGKWTSPKSPPSDSHTISLLFVCT